MTELLVSPPDFRRVFGTRRLHVLALCGALSAACADATERPVPLDAGADAASADAMTDGPDADEAYDTSGLEVNADWRPYPHDTPYDGKTIEELALSWSHWRLSQTDCVRNPANDQDGALCALDQDVASSVFFLAPGDYVATRSNCTVSKQQALLVPLTYFFADGVSSPLGIDTPPEMLESEARKILESMRDLVLVIDGQKIDVGELLSIGPLSFSHTVPQQGNYYECSGYEDVSGTVAPIYLVGYFALLPSPGLGRHRIVFGGTYSYLGWEIVNRVHFTFGVE